MHFKLYSIYLRRTIGLRIEWMDESLTFGELYETLSGSGCKLLWYTLNPKP